MFVRQMFNSIDFIGGELITAKYWQSPVCLYVNREFLVPLLLKISKNFQGHEKVSTWEKLWGQ